MRPRKSRSVTILIATLLAATTGGLFFFFKNEAYKRDGRPSAQSRPDAANDSSDAITYMFDPENGAL